MMFSYEVTWFKCTVFFYYIKGLVMFIYPDEGLL